MMTARVVLMNGFDVYAYDLVIGGADSAAAGAKLSKNSFELIASFPGFGQRP